jgi:subtilase family serine protease
VLLQLEELETRALLSASSATPVPQGTAAANEVVQPSLIVYPQSGPGHPQATPAISGYTPTQIQQAYGVSSLLSGGTNGKGETIAIVDAYYDPDIVNDAKTFNTQFSLQQFNVTGGPTLKVVASGGGSASKLSQDSTGGWQLETSLDVEWAHAIAPQANILLVEAPSESLTDLMGAVQYAANQPGVVTVSMSWGEYEVSNESSYDSYFKPKTSSNTKGAQAGVTFVAASGDSGAGPIYPATSPNVLAVGGTTLSTTTSSSGATTYKSESAWSGSGGGVSGFEGEPSYQHNQSSINKAFGYPNVEVYNPVTGTYSYYYSRMTPDVAYNADPSSGFAIYDSIASPDYGTVAGWNEVGGTSAGAPQWSAIVALADQQRAAKQEKPLDTNQVQNTLYNTLGTTTYTQVFHPITTGSNGFSAAYGYNLATGLGTPKANNLVPFLANTTIPQGQLPTVKGSGDGIASSGAGTSLSTLTTLVGSSGRAQPGVGQYTSSGSLSISLAPNGANTLSGQTAAANAPASSPVTSSFSTTDAETSAATFASSLVDNLSTLTPASLFASVGNTTPAAATNAPAAQTNALFGASGWNGSDLSWRQSSLGLLTPKGDPMADTSNGEDFSPGDIPGLVHHDKGGPGEGGNTEAASQERKL